MRIEKANLDDATKLTALTIRSKSFWGYSKEQVENWREDLTITPEHLNTKSVYKLIVDEVSIAFYSFHSEDDKKVRLDFLFVEPKFIGYGYGRKMLSDFTERVKKLNYKTVVLDADPNAAAFYKKNGFQVIGKLESSIKNRYLPIMELKLH